MACRRPVRSRPESYLTAVTVVFLESDVLFADSDATRRVIHGHLPNAPLVRFRRNRGSEFRGHRDIQLPGAILVDGAAALSAPVALSLFSIGT